MGKEWLYWAGGGGSSRRSAKRENSSGGGGGGGGGERESTTPGCMCAVLQLFDFHPFPYPLNHHSSFLPEDQTTTTLKGLEAPRNSLELEVPSIGAASSLSSSTLKDEENLSIPMGIQIKTRRSRTDELSSEHSSSPSTKSPNLVARLMGLDLLPDHKPNTCSSTSSSKHWSSNPPSKSQLHPRLVKSDIDITGTRSLPETPRISSARRSDVDPHHRLSLQINKENRGNNLSEEFEIIPCGTTRLRRRDLKLIDENRSTRHYAREIVKQVKEKVGRRVGIHDITNTVKNRGDRLIRDDDDDDHHVVLLKSKKPYSKGGLLRMDDEMSPRLKSAIKNLNSESPKYSQSTKLVSPIKSKSQSFQEHGEQVKQKISSSKCKKGVGERFNQRLKKPIMQTSDAIRTKQEEQFVRSSTINRVNHSDKKSKKTPLLDIPIKKDPSPPATTLPQKQESDSATSKQNTQLSSCLSHSYYHQETTHKPTAQESNNNKKKKDDDRFNGSTTATTTADKGAEYQYITRILKGTNIDKNTQMSFTNLYSLLPHHHHPLDPSIFHFLELSLQTNTIIVATSSPHDLLLSQRCNRKLIFQLVDEILGEILKTHINFNPWVGFINSSINCGSELLVDTVYEKIQSYPLADCRVLEDIDSLIDQDLGKFTKNQRFIELEEEGESIVLEIENQIVDSLVGETAMVVFGVFGYGRTVTESDGGHMGRSRDEMLFVGSWDPLFKHWDS